MKDKQQEESSSVKSIIVQTINQRVSIIVHPPHKTHSSVLEAREYQQRSRSNFLQRIHPTFRHHLKGDNIDNERFQYSCARNAVYTAFCATRSPSVYAMSSCLREFCCCECIAHEHTCYPSRVRNPASIWTLKGQGQKVTKQIEKDNARG